MNKVADYKIDGGVYVPAMQENGYPQSELLIRLYSLKQGESLFVHYYSAMSLNGRVSRWAKKVGRKYGLCSVRRGIAILGCRIYRK